MTKWLRENLWRHITGWIMCAFAVFPLYLVLLSAFNENVSIVFVPLTEVAVTLACVDFLISSIKEISSSME